MAIRPERAVFLYQTTFCATLQPPTHLTASYETYFSLYSSIFSLPPSIPMYHVPGNHDIPLGPWPQFSPAARDRYAKHFGTPNEVITVANHSIVLLDSVSLVEEDYRRYASEMQFGEWDGVEGGVIEFVKSIGDGELYLCRTW